MTRLLNIAWWLIVFPVLIVIGIVLTWTMGESKPRDWMDR